VAGVEESIGGYERAYAMLHAEWYVDGRKSAHDCRHHWATCWADKVDVLRLQEAGGWSSLHMSRRYVEEAEIANAGMTKSAVRSGK
jgi:integrase